MHCLLPYLRCCDRWGHNSKNQRWTVSERKLLKMKCNLLPRIQVHALIYVAETKVYALKLIQNCHYLATRKIDVLRIQVHAIIFQICHQTGRFPMRICYFICSNRSKNKRNCFNLVSLTVNSI